MNKPSYFVENGHRIDFDAWVGGHEALTEEQAKARLPKLHYLGKAKTCCLHGATVSLPEYGYFFSRY